MIGPSINTMFAGLIEAVNANGAKSLLNVRLKSSATPKDKAEFEQPDASVAAINYRSGRKLNKELIDIF